MLTAWGLAHAEPLDGGQGTSWRGGDTVLKPVLDEREATWVASVLHDLQVPDDLRVIRPAAAVDGRWVVDGWSAWHWLDGEHDPSRWREVLDIADRFGECAATVGRSPALERTHAWAVGDAFAWDERMLDVPPSMRSITDELEGRRTSLDLPSQLVHGDLCNNVLFHPELPPAVIDVSPFWRPARYSAAIVAADLVGWFGGTRETLDRFGDPVGAQLLVRATLFRLGSAIVLCADAPDRLAAETAAYARLLAMLPD